MSNDFDKLIIEEYNKLIIKMELDIANNPTKYITALDYESNYKEPIIQFIKNTFNTIIDKKYIDKVIRCNFKKSLRKKIDEHNEKNGYNSKFSKTYNIAKTNSQRQEFYLLKKYREKYPESEILYQHKIRYKKSFVIPDFLIVDEDKVTIVEAKLNSSYKDEKQKTKHIDAVVNYYPNKKVEHIYDFENPKYDYNFDSDVPNRYFVPTNQIDNNNSQFIDHPWCVLEDVILYEYTFNPRKYIFEIQEGDYNEYFSDAEDAWEAEEEDLTLHYYLIIYTQYPISFFKNKKYTINIDRGVYGKDESFLLALEVKEQ